METVIMEACTFYNTPTQDDVDKLEAENKRLREALEGIIVQAKYFAECYDLDMEDEFADAIEALMQQPDVQGDKNVKPSN